MVEARVRWRAEEEAALDLGVQQLGAGHWADILSAHKAAFDPCRTSVDLKDNWRTVLRKRMRDTVSDAPPAAQHDASHGTKVKARKLPRRELGGLKNAVTFPCDVQQMRREQGRDHIASLDTHRQKPRANSLCKAAACHEPWLNSGSLVELLDTHIFGTVQ